MALFGKTWFLALVACIIHVGVIGGALFSTADLWMPPRPEPPEVAEPHEVITAFERTFGFSTREIDELARELVLREQKLEQRALDLQEIEKRLDLERADLLTQQEILDAKLQRLKTFTFEIEEMEKINLEGLVRIYSEMPVTDVIRVFEELPERQVHLIIAFMDREVVRKIFQEMIRTDTGAGDNVRRVAQWTDVLRRKRYLGEPETESVEMTEE